MITHYNLVAGMTVLFGDEIVPEDAVVLNLLPFYHIYALVFMMGGCLHLGSKLVLLSRFEPNSFLKTLQDYEVWLVFLRLQLYFNRAFTEMITLYNLINVQCHRKVLFINVHLNSHAVIRISL